MTEEKVVSLSGAKVLSPGETSPGVRARANFVLNDLDTRAHRAIAVVLVDDQHRITTCLSWEAGYALSLLGGVTHLANRIDKQFNDDFDGENIKHDDP